MTVIKLSEQYPVMTLSYIYIFLATSFFCDTVTQPKIVLYVMVEPA